MNTNPWWLDTAIISGLSILVAAVARDIRQARARARCRRQHPSKGGR